MKTTKMFLGQWNSKKLSEHWDKVAKDLDDFSKAPSTAIYRQSEIDLIKSAFGNIKGKRFLKMDLWNEVNNTRILSWIARSGAITYGTDISGYLVEKSKENFNNEHLKAKFVKCDMREMNFPDNYFDFLYTMGTIEHVYDFEAAIREIYRVVKPGGKAIVGIPNRLDPFLRPVMVWFMDLFGWYAYSPEHSFTRRELNLMLRVAGFKIVGDSGVLFMPGWLRMGDLFLFKYLRPLNFLSVPFLKIFEYFERNYKWARRNSYLIAAIVEKPKF